MPYYARIAALYRHQATAWVMLMLGLMVTALAWFLTDRAVTVKAQERFGFQSAELSQAIQRRLLEYETILRGGVGFFEASSEVTREEWRRYVASLRLHQIFPGIQGLGFSLLMPEGEVADHVARVRAEGFPDYAIRPPGVRDPTSAIVFLEPFDWRNQRAFGYDMFSEPVRRAAMTQALESGEPALSGKVTLVQETDQAVQPGFLMYVPLYRRDLPTATAEERRLAIRGFVYAPFRMHDLMRGILPADPMGIGFALYDGDPAPDALLFDSAAYRAPAERAAGDADPRFATLIPIAMPHRTWTLAVTAPPGYLSLQEALLPYLVAGTGSVTALALFWVIASLARQRHRVETDARKLAGDLMANIQHQRLRLENILAGTHVGTWEWNVQTGEVIFNERWAEIIGYRLDDLQPLSIETWARLAHPDDFKLAGELLGRHFAGETPYYECEARMRHREGHWIWVLDRGKVATWSPEGQPLWMYGTHQDVTEQHVQAERLELAKQAAEAANQAKSAFLANMSHEIRTPMNAIIGLTEVLLASDHPPRQQATLDKINSAANSLLNLLTVILDYSALEAGHLSIQATSLHSADLLSATCALFRPKAEEKHLALDCSLAPSVPAILYGDPLRLRQVINSLVDNALKFTDRGAVKVEIEGAEPRDQTLLLKVTVRDTGIGMTPEQRERLFTPFDQVDVTTSRRHGGTGLGLSFCKRLVELMGGELGVESESGVGSRVWFSLRLGYSAAPALPGRAGIPVNGPGTPALAPRPAPPPLAGCDPVIDPASLLPRLTTLADMLLARMSKARRLSAEIQSLLAGSSLQAAYDPIAQAIAQLDYDSALAQLRDFMAHQNWGGSAQAAETLAAIPTHAPS